MQYNCSPVSKRCALRLMKYVHIDCQTIQALIVIRRMIRLVEIIWIVVLDRLLRFHYLRLGDDGNIVRVSLFIGIIYVRLWLRGWCG